MWPWLVIKTPNLLLLGWHGLCSFMAQQTEKNVHPDLTNGKGTGISPALGINRGGSFVQRAHSLEYLNPSAEVKSLVEISS